MQSTVEMKYFNLTFTYSDLDVYHLITYGVFRFQKRVRSQQPQQRTTRTQSSSHRKNCPNPGVRARRKRKEKKREAARLKKEVLRNQKREAKRLARKEKREVVRRSVAAARKVHKDLVDQVKTLVEQVRKLTVELEAFKPKPVAPKPPSALDEKSMFFRLSRLDFMDTFLWKRLKLERRGNKFYFCDIHYPSVAYDLRSIFGRILLKGTWPSFNEREVALVTSKLWKIFEQVDKDKLFKDVNVVLRLMADEYPDKVPKSFHKIVIDPLIVASATQSSSTSGRAVSQDTTLVSVAPEKVQSEKTKVKSSPGSKTVSRNYTRARRLDKLAKALEKEAFREFDDAPQEFGPLPFVSKVPIGTIRKEATQKTRPGNRKVYSGKSVVQVLDMLGLKTVKCGPAFSKRQKSVILKPEVATPVTSGLRAIWPNQQSSVGIG
jgi:hypothetical protein